MNTLDITHCPVCGQPVDKAFQSESDRRFCAYSFEEVQAIYGPPGIAHRTVCEEGRWLHIVIEGVTGDEHRLVRLAGKR